MFWTANYPNKLRSKVKVGVFSNAESGMCATGVPHHIHLMKSVQNLEERIEHMNVALHSLNDSVKENNTTKSNHNQLSPPCAVHHCTCSTNHSSSEFKEVLTLLTNNIISLSTNKSGGIGADGISAQHYANATPLLSTTVDNSTSSSADTLISRADTSDSSEPSYQQYLWGGTFHLFPENFQINTYVKPMINYILNLVFHLILTIF